MAEPSLLELFVRPLTNARIAYFITGGVATVVYGEPRFTRDIDLVVTIERDDAPRFLALWPEALFYAPPLEALEEEIARSRLGHCNIVHAETGLVADCYLAGDDALHAWAFRHVRVLAVDDLTIHVAPVEYVIARKLSYYQQSGSTRHLEDVERMRAVQGDLIDQAALDELLDALGVRHVWQRLQSQG